MQKKSCKGYFYSLFTEIPYSHTLEKRSSAPPNPPAGLVGLVVAVAEVVPDETGAALVHPPKSSSTATVGAGFGAALGAPQPLLMSFAVRVSGTRIMDDAVDGAAGAGSGAASGVLHALPPQGSMLADITLAAVAVATGTSGFGAAWGWGCKDGPERLNAELNSCCGEDTAGFGGDIEAAGAAGGEDRPKRSLERDDEGGLGFAGFGAGEVKPPKKS